MQKEQEETRNFEDTSVAERDWYTQREWDRCVGYDTVPEEYKKPLTSRKE